MKYRVVEYYSYIGRTLWFRVDYKRGWLYPWLVERSFDTKEKAISYIEKEKSNKEKVVYVSK